MAQAQNPPGISRTRASATTATAAATMQPVRNDLRGVGLLEARQEEDPQGVRRRRRPRRAGAPTPEGGQGQEAPGADAETLGQEVDEWLAGAREGRILNKREQPYKPAVIRNYEIALGLRVLPTLGDRKLADIDLADLLELKEQLLGEGCSGSTIRNIVRPVAGDLPARPAERRRAVEPDRRPRPTHLRVGATVPRHPRRRRSCSACSPAFEALWATAFYAGFVAASFAGCASRTSTSRRQRSGSISRGTTWRGRSRRSRRQAPGRCSCSTCSASTLKSLVRWGDGLFFGSSPDQPFEPRNIDRKARRALKTENEGRVEGEAVLVEWFGLHEAAIVLDLMDPAGVSETRADRYMGHAAPGVAGRYRHLLPASSPKTRSGSTSTSRALSPGRSSRSTGPRRSALPEGSLVEDAPSRDSAPGHHSNVAVRKGSQDPSVATATTGASFTWSATVVLGPGRRPRPTQAQGEVGTEQPRGKDPGEVDGKYNHRTDR